LLREMVRSFAEGLMGAEADSVCGAGYGERSPERINRHQTTSRKRENLLTMVYVHTPPQVPQVINKSTAHIRHYVRRPAWPWQCLYLRPDPQGHRSFRPISGRAVE